MSITIAHLSDLHFSAGTTRGDSHRHSLELLGALSKSLAAEGPFSKVIVSGDLSDKGDLQSLQNARSFLLHSIEINPGETIGLNLRSIGPGKSLSVVAGNHDAHNGTQGSGKARVIWQKSTEHFYSKFPESQNQQLGCEYEWLDHGEWGVFVVYVDTCFLGDPRDHLNPDRVYITDRIAVGKLAVEKSADILHVLHLGLKGDLVDPRTQTQIPASKFATSFKILVTHHYLFEEQEHIDYFHRIRDRNRVFQNIAMADFDLLLCGHKHRAFLKAVPYGEHFDNRARVRLTFNYLRVILGLRPLPVQERIAGKVQHRLLTLLAQVGQILALRTRNTPVSPDASAKAIAVKMLEWIDHPDRLLNRVAAMLEHGPLPDEHSESEIQNEVREILCQFRDISHQHKQSIRHKLDRIKTILGDFQHRPFVQAMCGSTCKSATTNDKARYYYKYTIDRHRTGYSLVSTQFIAAPTSDLGFAKSPQQHPPCKFLHNRLYAGDGTLFSAVDTLGEHEFKLNPSATPSAP